MSDDNLGDDAWRGGRIEPPADGGIPEHLRLHLARFVQGCEVCGVMNWRCKRADEDGAVYECIDCGNVFEQPVIEEENPDV